MRIIEQSHEIIDPINGLEILNKIEKAARICYKSEEKICFVKCPKCSSDNGCKWEKWHSILKMVPSSLPFIDKLLHQTHHESVIEHVNISVKFVTARSVTHELCRHRLMSFSQESTRYCSYAKEKFGKEITVIKPVWYDLNDLGASRVWEISMQRSERDYFDLLELKWAPEKAREVLPNSLKTEILCTGNLREWIHVLKLRTSKKAHPQIRALMIGLLKEFQEKIPVIFEDIVVEE